MARIKRAHENDITHFYMLTIDKVARVAPGCVCTGGPRPRPHNSALSVASARHVMRPCRERSTCLQPLPGGRDGRQAAVRLLEAHAP